MAKEINFELLMDPEATPYIELRLVSMNSITGQGKNETISFEVQEGGYSFIITSGATQIKRGPKKQRKSEYPIEEWQDQLTWRLNKGWVPTSIEKRGTKTVQISAGYESVENSSIQALLDLLVAANNEYVSTTYSKEIEDIPLEDIDNAQNILVELSNACGAGKISVAVFNKALLQIWILVPRPIAKMKKLMASSSDQFDEIIAREQDILDNLQQMLRATNTNNIKGQTILDAHNLEMRDVTEEETAMIKNLLTDQANHFSRAWKVTNKDTESRFNAYCAAERLSEENGIHHLFHGSGFANWWSIMKSGLYLNPALIKPGVRIAGKAFGYGIYFAPYAGKSMHYTDGSMYSGAAGRNKVYLAIFKVATGKPYYIYSEKGGTPHNWTDFHKDHPDRHCCWAECGKVKDGDDSLWRLTWDEVIVYQEQQTTIEYLIEMKR